LRAAFTSAERRIGGGRDRNPQAGEAEDQFVRLLAPGETAALAGAVAQIAKHEKVAERGAGKPRHVVGLAGDQPAREMPDVARGTRGGRIRRRHLRGDVGPQHNSALTREVGEAVGEIDVIGGQRRRDLPLGNRRAETLVDRAVGQHDGIVLRRQEPGGFEGIRRQCQPHARQRERGGERPEDALARHVEVPSGMGARHCAPDSHIGSD
jgi:hypothetical protein